MSGLSECHVGASVHDVAEYLRALVKLKDAKGNSLKKILVEAQVINANIEKLMRAGVDSPAEIARQLNEMDVIKGLGREIDAKFVEEYQVRKNKKRVRGAAAGMTLSPNMAKALNPKVGFQGDPSQVDPDNPLNENIDTFRSLVRDGEIINVEAVLPGNVVEDFWNDRLKGRREYSENYRRRDYDTYIVTVIDKDKGGNVIMEEYVDPKDPLAGPKQRPKTSVRAISYNAHLDDEDQDTAEGTIIQDEVMVEAFRSVAKNIAREAKKDNAASLAERTKAYYGKHIGEMMGANVGERTIAAETKVKMEGQSIVVSSRTGTRVTVEADKAQEMLPENFLRRQREKKRA